MTQEDKELLLKDLCSRLQYGVMCDISGYKNEYYDSHLGYNIHNQELEPVRVIGYHNGLIDLESYKIDSISVRDELDNFKLYLRPMSSMTEEERKEYMNENVLDNCDEMNNIQEHYKELRNCPKNQVDEYYHQYIQLPRVHAEDYLNSIHVDYRGLISKGLALEATEGMYNS